MALIDPFKHVGEMSAWGRFGDSEHDEVCDAERRALCDFFLRRLAKARKRLGVNDETFTPSLLAGGMVGFAGLFVSAKGGTEGLTDQDFERWIGVATFAWYQAISCFDGGSAVQ